MDFFGFLAKVGLGIWDEEDEEVTRKARVNGDANVTTSKRGKGGVEQSGIRVGPDVLCGKPSLSTKPVKPLFR
jgi:hypothetical protein